MASGTHCFVGHVFNQQQIDDLRTAIQEAFNEVAPLPLCYADEYLVDGGILEKVEAAIDDSLFCIFEVSEPNPNVFMELGYAKRAGKRCMLLLSKGRALPADIAGSDHVQYGSYAELTKELKRLLPGFIGKRGDVDMRVLVAVVEYVGFPCFSIADVHRRAEEIARKPIDARMIQESFQILEETGKIEKADKGYRLTAEGSTFLTDLCEKACLRRRYGL